MTAALLLLILGLSAQLVAFDLSAPPRARCIAFGCAGVAALPLAFGPIIPISHFMFETTGTTMLRLTQLVAAVLLAVHVVRTVAGAKQHDRGTLTLRAGALICQSVWLVSAIALSDYEQGTATPNVWDAPAFVADWVAAVVLCSLLAASAWRLAGSGKIYRALTVAYFLLTILVAAATVA